MVLLISNTGGTADALRVSAAIAQHARTLRWVCFRGEGAAEETRPVLQRRVTDRLNRRLARAKVPHRITELSVCDWRDPSIQVTLTAHGQSVYLVFSLYQVSQRKLARMSQEGQEYWPSDAS